MAHAQLFVESLEARALMSANPAATVSHVALGDVNGDGRMDLIAASARASLAQPGTTLASVTVALGVAGPHGLPASASGDANGDGTVDGADFLVWQRNGAFARPTTTETILPGSSYNAISLGDVNGDGRADVRFTDHREGIIAILIGLYQPGHTFGAVRIHHAGASSLVVDLPSTLGEF